jgi:hypothetical protein
MESALKFLTIQVLAACWLVLLPVHMLYERRGLKNTIGYRRTDLSIPYYRRALDSSKCSDIVCIEGRPLVLSPPLYFMFYSSIIILIIFFSFLSL